MRARGECRAGDKDKRVEGEGGCAVCAPCAIPVGRRGSARDLIQ